MKTRLGFVSNSSSSSFILEKKDLTELQIVLIKNYFIVAKKLYDEGLLQNLSMCDCWSIVEHEDTIEGYTDMDNFYMYLYLKFIGIDLKPKKWG